MSRKLALDDGFAGPIGTSVAAIDGRAAKVLRSSAVRSVGQIVGAALEALRSSQRRFAELVDLDESNVSAYVRGQDPLPPKHLDRWIAALQLTAIDAEDFRRAVLLSHSPPEIRELVQRLDLERAEAVALVALYEDRVARILQMVEALVSMRRPTSPPPKRPAWPPDPDAPSSS
jgi:transcriptional regulator with XRE-family HTH domain